MKKNQVKEQIDNNSNHHIPNSLNSTQINEKNKLQIGYNLLNVDELYHMLNKKNNGQKKVQSWSNYTIRDYSQILNFMDNYSSFFEDQYCLDFGCDDGQFAFNLLYQFNPKLIRAIDFNYKLLEEAVELKEIIRNQNRFQNSKKEKEFLEFLEKCPQNLLNKKFGNSIQQLYKKNICSYFLKKLNTLKKSKEINLEQLQDKLIFQMENPFRYKPNIKFDVIICLHYLKHFHFSFGDKVLESFFQQIKSLLKSKGVLLIDLGSFREYYQMEKKKSQMKQKIQLKQDKLSSWMQKKFRLILLDQILIQSNRKKRLHLFLSYQIDFQVIKFQQSFILC